MVPAVLPCNGVLPKFLAEGSLEDGKKLSRNVNGQFTSDCFLLRRTFAGDYTTRLRDVFLFAFQDGSLRSCAGRKRRQVQRHDETASRSVCCSDAAAVTPDRPFRYG